MSQDPVPGAANSQTDGPLLSGPLLGEVSGDGALVWAQARDSSPLTLTLCGGDGSRVELVAEPRPENGLCVVFALSGLVPGRTYEYFLSSPSAQPAATARSSLVAGPAPDARTVRLAFGSCYSDYWLAELPIFEAIAREAPHAFVMLGDNCYFAEADWQSEHTMMLAYLRNRNNPVFRELVKSTPVLAIYDDHDFGPNDANGTFGGRDQALATFCRMWAQRSYGLPAVPGIFSAVRLGPVELFLTDGRYHRGVGGNTVLGRPQFDWLLDRLRQSEAPIKLVASGSVVLAKNPFYHDWESWRRSAADELEELLGAIENEGIAGVMFLSGDLHMGQVHHLPGRPLAGGRGRGPDFWDVTSSPLAIAPYNENIAWPEEARIAQVYDRHNYGVIEVDLDRHGAEVVLFLKDSQGQVLFRQQLALSTLASAAHR